MRERKKPGDQAYARDVIDAVVHMSRSLNMVQLPGSLSPERLEALRLIDKHGPAGVSSLADLAQLRPASMSRMVTVLVDLGLARRRNDKVDGRAVSISLTARGRQVLRRAEQVLIKRTALALEQLTTEEAAILPGLASKLGSLGKDDKQP